MMKIERNLSFHISVFQCLSSSLHVASMEFEFFDRVRNKKNRKIEKAKCKRSDETKEEKRRDETRWLTKSSTKQKNRFFFSLRSGNRISDEQDNQNQTKCCCCKQIVFIVADRNVMLSSHRSLICGFSFFIDKDFLCWNFRTEKIGDLKVKNLFRHLILASTPSEYQNEINKEKTFERQLPFVILSLGISTCANCQSDSR